MTGNCASELVFTQGRGVQAFVWVLLQAHGDLGASAYMV